MLHSPKVSVIMGVYNCEKTVSISIESILNQTYDNWELIICDDNSTDGSYNICVAFKNKHPQKIILLRNKKNMRLAYSLNRCLEFANGEYIARMDADDIALPNRIQFQVNYMLKHPKTTWLGTSCELIDDEGKWGKRIQKEQLTKEEIFLKNQFIHPSVIIRKDALLSVGGYTVSNETRRGQDYDLWCKLTAHGFIGENTKEILLQYREDRDSFTKKKFVYRLDSVKVRKKWFKELNLPSKYYLSIYRPLIVGLIPQNILQKIHKLRFENK